MFLKNKNIIFKIRRSKVTDYAALMKVENIAECLEHSAIHLTCIKQQLVLKTNFGLFESGRFRPVLL